MTDVTKPTSGENLIYRKIQQAKTRGIAFVRVASIFKSAPEDKIYRIIFWMQKR